MIEAQRENLSINKLIAEKKRNHICRRRYDSTRFETWYFKHN